MPTMTPEQIQALQQRGLIQEELDWLNGLPNAEAQWQALGTFEARAQMRQAGFSADEIGKLEAFPFGTQEWWAKAQYVQHLRTVDWNALAARGYTLQEMQWIQNAGSAEQGWQAVASIERRLGNIGPGGGPIGPNPLPNFPGMPSIPGGIASENASAKAFIQATLEMYGLGSLGDWAWKSFLNGAPIEQIFLEMRQRPEYKTRFPAMEALAKQGRAFSEAEYIAYERQVVGIMRAAGIPEGFYDQPNDFKGLLEKNLSIAEVSDRVIANFQKVASTAPEIRQAFASYYGASGDAALAAVYLDPTKALPALEKMTAAATFGGYGKAGGFDIAKTQATRAAELGFSDEAVREGFSKLGDVRPLFNETITEREDWNVNEQGVAAMFELEPGTRQKVERRREEREAAFAGSPGAGAIVTTEGVLGLGSGSRRRQR